ncbi:DUF3369 domain-containing protein [bacterium]|nr:DUF3369 domain-containing protein [bacterium]
MPMVEIPVEDVVLFASEDVHEPDERRLVVIVDEDEAVHRRAREMLAGRPVTFLSAYSTAGARDMLRDHPEVAVVLLDDGLERDGAGLRLMQFLRHELGNHRARVVLRPSQQLRTRLLVALREYHEIQLMTRAREGMRSVLDAGRALFAHRDVDGLVAQVLHDLVELVASDPHSLRVRGAVASPDLVVCRTCRMDPDLVGRPLGDLLPPKTRHVLPMVLDRGTGVFRSDGYLGVLGDEDQSRHVLHLAWDHLGVDADRDLVRLFMANASMAYRNLALSKEIQVTQREIIHTLSQVVETRSNETANHVLRVGLLAARLGELAGLSPTEIDVLRMVAPMHDVGKVGIPDAVLLKPGALTDEERRLINGHTIIGHTILSRSERRMLRAAAVVALQHHERWDGGGYPEGLAGEAIHLHARITAIVDVYDALTQDRVYRPAMSHERAIELIASDAGQAFDPQLAGILVTHEAEFRAIRDAHPDEA